jgi:hypothetical protein
MHDPCLRAVPKGLIADEVWALVQDPFAAAILERSLKAYRSLGGFALPIVQDPRDLDTPAGRVILVNTATKVILPMDRSGQDEISRFVRLNDRELDLVRDLRLVKRRYSEFFVSVEGIHSAKGLVIPDPLRYAISTTDPSDETELDRLYRQTGDMLQTVRQFARDMPYGIGAPGKSALASRGRARWALLVSILATSIALVLVLAWPRPVARMAPAPTPDSQIVDRERAAQQAARLLTTAPAVVDTDAASRPESDRPTGGSPAATAPTPQADRTAKAIEDLRTLARSWSVVPPGPHEELTTSTATRRPVPATPVGGKVGPKPPIPDRIEDTSSESNRDPLQDVSLQANILTVSPTQFPWELIEIRVSQTPPQARLGKGGGAVASEGAWFEPGDSPVPGWILVGIVSDYATLMSSQGDLVQLPVAGPSRDADHERTSH